jgi:hypothetical protein
MLNSTVFIRPTTSQDQGAWNHYVCNHPGGTAYQLSGFIRAIEAAYRFKSICFVAQGRQQNQGRVQGILPLIHLHAPFTKGALVSLPYCDAGGVLADSSETEAVLLAHAMAYAALIIVSAIQLYCCFQAKVFHGHFFGTSSRGSSREVYLVQQIFEQISRLFSKESLSCGRPITSPGKVVVNSCQGCELACPDSVQAVMPQGQLTIPALYAGT